MTVKTQLQTALASSQSVESSLSTFALETENQQAKQLFENLAEQQKNITTMIEGRYQQVLQEEPQFNQSQQMQNQNPDQSQ
ncbi:DUF1657 domain-containing protein [bacterium LRH843]|nr:DUF1657 domain-containing protein [bacterium LRH843]